MTTFFYRTLAKEQIVFKKFFREIYRFLVTNFGLSYFKDLASNFSSSWIFGKQANLTTLNQRQTNLIYKVFL